METEALHLKILYLFSSGIEIADFVCSLSRDQISLSLQISISTADMNLTFEGDNIKNNH